MYYVRQGNAKPWQEFLIGIIFLLIGIGLFVFFFFTIQTYNEKNKSYIEITSEVTDYQYNDQGLKAEIFEYIVDGKTYHKISNSYSNTEKPIGSKVQIKYNPKDPRDAIFKHDSTNVIVPIMGGLFTLFGCFDIMISIKHRKKLVKMEE